VNTVNRIVGGIMDVILKPLELLGPEFALILVSGIFGILGLLIFKQISWQAGIKRTKDQIKGDMIAIRLYQDDLLVVGGAVIRIFLRNFKYLALNLMPILPLLVPGVLVLAQLVVRYAYDPIPVQTSDEQTSFLPGKGTMIEIFMKEDQKAAASRVTLRYPEGIEVTGSSELPTRNAFEGRVFQEIVATAPVEGVIELLVDGQVVGTKEIVAGTERPLKMQPKRVSSFWPAWIFPAEDTFPADNPIASIEFAYPQHELRVLPGGEGGILLVFFVASMAFGIAIMKPLNIEI
jgi:hypothetical protein